MTNMYDKSTQKATVRVNNGEWDMKNKNKTYEEVVNKNPMN